MTEQVGSRVWIRALVLPVPMPCFEEAKRIYIWVMKSHGKYAIKVQ